MKIASNRMHPVDVDIVRQTTVSTQQPAAPAALAGRVEMNDLAGGVHTGVGATGAHDVDGFRCDPRKRLLQTLLHTDAGLLTLPAVVRGAVVLDAERDTDVCYPLAGERIE